VAQRVLVVDDDREIVRLLRAYLEREGFQVVVALDGEEALHALRREKPDLVVLDLMLPKRDGWEITRVVRADPSLQHIPIIMLTARSEEADRVVGLELGADDYVVKPFSPREVVARVKAVLRRASPNAPRAKLLRVLDLELDLDAHRATLGGRELDLTPTEFEILRAMMQSPGHAFTRLELIERAFGYAYEGMERTVDTHIKNLRRKLSTDGDPQAYIETVYGVGYRLRS
jgi:two-component system alkaline phosphatase synthesis response regulator PhoP